LIIYIYASFCVKMEITSTQLNNYNTVWFQIMSQKIQIIYDIALYKKVVFIELLKEFVPEAFEHKKLWEHKYILTSSSSSTKTPPPKKFIIKKKSK